MLILSRSDVEALLDLEALIDALADAMAGLSAGRASMPSRNFAFVPDRGAVLGAMPSHLHGTLAAKLVTVFPSNAELGIPTHQALIAVFDSATGVPAAVMDGAYITAVRTAAGSALATRLLAREDARVLAIIGTGVQARAHARLLSLVRNFAEVRIAGRTPERVAALATEIGAVAASSYEDAIRGADVVCACTHPHEPVVRRQWLSPGTHVTSVGFSEGAEVDEATVRDSLVAVESRAAALGAYPNGAVELAGISDPVEVGELVLGTRTGRTSPGEITLYKSVGVAVQDAAAAAAVLRAAQERGRGAEVAI